MTTRHVVHAALWLVVALVGVAGSLLVLGAELVALVLVLVYVGAVVVLVLFALMLTRAPIGPDLEHRAGPWRTAGRQSSGRRSPFSWRPSCCRYPGRRRACRRHQHAGRRADLRHLGLAVRAALLLLLVALVAALAVSASRARRLRDPPRRSLPPRRGPRGSRSVRESRCVATPFCSSSASSSC